MSQTPPSALLLTAPGCPHCLSVREGLSRLLEEGKLDKLEIINLAEQPEVAAELGIRSVPWTRIGSFEITGSQSYGELLKWVEAAQAGGGTAQYYQHLLEHRGLNQVVEQIKARPATLQDLLLLLESLETPMSARIGVGAVLEDLAGTGLLDDIIPGLARLTRSPEPQIRADACHYLSLTHNKASLQAIRPLLEDEHPDVREIAMESLAILEAD